MATPIMPFLRPLGPPRPSTLGRFLRSSSSRRCYTETTEQKHGSALRPSTAQEDANLTASRTASDVYPPRSLRSSPRPKVSIGSRRTAYPKKDRPYAQDDRAHTQPKKRTLIPGPVIPLEPHLCAPNLPYYVNRTSSNELPVYNMEKRAGSMLLTHVKKIDGKVEALRDELVKALRKDQSEVTINPLTRHILIKGHHKDVVLQYLWERRF